MNRRMNGNNRSRIIMAFIFSFHCFGGNAQESEIGNYILRNKDFVERRAHNTLVNFAREYYQATASLQSAILAKKGNSEWVPIGPFGNEDLAGTGRVNSMAFHPTDTSIWYICVAQGGIWKTTNAGISWTSISGNLPILRTSCLAVDPQNPDIMYVALGDFAYLGHNLLANESKRNTHYGLGVYKTSDGGQSWFPTSLSFKETDFEGSLISKIIIHPGNTDHVIAVGESGAYVSTNAGNHWTKTDQRLIWDLDQDPNNPDVLIASTGYVYSYNSGEAGVIRSSDFGMSWTNAQIPIPKTLAAQRIELAIAPSDNNYVYALACDTIGGFYGFYRSTDAGQNFIEMQNSSYPYNILYNEFDQTPGGQGTYDLAICVDRNNRDHVVIGGINMWQTQDGGQTFNPVTYWRLNYNKLSMHADIHEIHQHPLANSFFACHDGGISRSDYLYDEDILSLKSQQVQTEWTNFTKGLNISSFYRLSIGEIDSKKKIAGAQDNSTVMTDGTDFSNLTGGDGMESEMMDYEGYWFTSSQFGSIYAFQILGDQPYFEGKLVIPNQEHGDWTTPFIGADGYLFVLFENLYSFQGSFQVATCSSFPFASDGYPRVGTALDIQNKKAQRMYIAKRGYNSVGIQNQILTSDKRGQQWSDISQGLPRNQYPSYIEMSQSDPNEVWITFSGFDSSKKVYHSLDAGANWTNISYNLPNIPVNCVTHQEDGHGTIYIGTDHGVYYLKHDSSSWEYYSEGLPKVIISELEIDTASRTLVAATFGRGLWEVSLVDYDSTDHTSIGRLVARDPLQVYPNPAKTRVMVSGDFPQSGKPVHLKVVDITGRTVMEREVQIVGGKITESLDVTGLLSGEYFVVLWSDIARRTGRFVKE
ncbi:MAG: T9SS type A sorting domain-containing protein [Bacteroidetes bacterium]|nr:T9SS type A sorting domain-containing protein [Bacteroidota bacterium]